MSCHRWVFISLLAKLASAVLHRLGFAATVCPCSPHIIEQPAGSGCDMDSPPNNQANNQSIRAGNFDSLPFLTADLPGTGGTLKQEPEDFVVEEIPAYEPCGEGEHLFLWMEKQDVSGEELLRHVARRLGISSGDIGMAGIKDRRAITRQWISVPVRCEPLAAQIETERIKVLTSARHGNKL